LGDFLLFNSISWKKRGSSVRGAHRQHFVVSQCSIEFNLPKYRNYIFTQVCANGQRSVDTRKLNIHPRTIVKNTNQTHHNPVDKTSIFKTKGLKR